MAFDFPATPANGDKFTSGGVEYIWTGSTWDLSSGGDLADYVLKAGDTMTGKLNIDTGIEHGLDLRSDAGVRTMSLSASSATHSGIIEFWDPNGTTRRGYIGYGDANSLNLTGEGTATWSVKNGLFMNGGLGIRWGSDSAVTGQHDMSKGICLYGSGTTSQFGFNITSGTLNYIVQNAGNKHQFVVGTENKLQLVAAGAFIPTVANDKNGYFIGDRFHGMYFHSGNKLVFTEYHDNFEWRRQTTGGAGGGDLRMSLNAGTLQNVNLKVPEGKSIRFHVDGSVICSTDNKAIRYGVNEDSWHIFKVGTDTEFTINSGGAGLRGLAPVAADLGLTPDSDGVVNIAKAMIAMLAKIKALETELATLRK